MDIQENSIALALAAINNGTSKRKAAKDYSISYTILQSSQAGGLTARTGYNHQK